MSPPERGRVLVVDDSPETLDVLEGLLTADGYHVVTATSVERAVDLLDDLSLDLVVTDLRFPGAGGLDLVRHLGDNFRSTGVIVITGYPATETAVAATKLGATEYLTKPLDPHELTDAVRRSLEATAAGGRNAGIEPDDPATGSPWGLIGDSGAMKEVFRTIRRAAATDVNVLIRGETGTGKELVARAIHRESARASGRFVAVNCAAVAAELLESELFGHVRGAFTGADRRKDGLFVAADGGTLLLDEIGEMSPELQAKLLRALDDRRVRPVGSAEERAVDVRVVAATNVDLEEAVGRGGFRADLYHRLEVVPIDLPPLRERDGDVVLLARHFLDRCTEPPEDGSKPRFSDRAVEALRSYAWPGNVRELENLVLRLVTTCDKEVIDPPDLPEKMRFKAAGGPGTHRTLKEVEREHIERVMADVGGNLTRAAERLGIDRKTLRRKLKRRER